MDPGPGEVACRVDACGVCGSDVTDWWVARKLPAVLGHEFGGTVAAVGHLTITYALLRASAASLSAYSYSQIGWATLLGWGVFMAIPDPVAWVGMLVIALGGLLLSVPGLMRLAARTVTRLRAP